MVVGLDFALIEDNYHGNPIFLFFHLKGIKVVHEMRIHS